MRKFNIELDISNRNNIGVNNLIRYFNIVGTRFEPNFTLLYQNNINNMRYWNIENLIYGFKVSSPLREATESNVCLLKNIINSVRESNNNITVDRNCNLLINIDILDFTNQEITALINTIYHIENSIFYLNPPSRKNNSNVITLFNFPITKLIEFNPDNITDGNSLYHPNSGLSFHNFHDKGMVQFRYCSSTLNGYKLMGWIRIFLSIIEIIKNNEGLYLPRDTKDVNNLHDFIKNHQINCEWLDKQKTICLKWIENRKKNLH